MLKDLCSIWITLLCCSVLIQCLPQPNVEFKKRQDASDLLLDGNGEGDTDGLNIAVSNGNLIDWSSVAKLKLTPAMKQSFASDPFGFFKQKVRQASSSSSSSLGDQLKQALNGGDFSSEGDENWVKAYTGPAIGGLASFNGADYDEGSSDGLVGKDGSNSNNVDDKKKGKGKKSKAWWAKFFDRQRGKSDHPTDPVNYGINPHGRYPTTNVDVKPQTGSENDENDENRPILNNMRKWLTKLWKPNEGGSASVTGPGVTNQQYSSD
uniref:Uncharacterized protein n=1 Tax=Tetranychus urticae TaxID=32264 RepID=T1JX42_TETUR